MSRIEAKDISKILLFVSNLFLPLRWIKLEHVILMVTMESALHKKIVINRTVQWAIIIFLIGVMFVGVLCYMQEGQSLNDLFAGLAFVTTLTLLFTQSSIMIQQQSENTFFLMIGQLREIADNIEFGQNWYRGKNVFKDFYNRLKQYKLNTHERDRESIINDVTKEKDYVLFENYYKYLYQILLFIDRMPLVSSIEKKNYAKILRSHLSVYELMMLFYHISINDNYCKYNSLVKKYNILDSITKIKDFADWYIFEKDKDEILKYKSDII